MLNYGLYPAKIHVPDVRAMGNEDKDDLLVDGRATLSTLIFSIEALHCVEKVVELRQYQFWMTSQLESASTGSCRLDGPIMEYNYINIIVVA